MTVAQLIEELKLLPPKAVIYSEVTSPLDRAQAWTGAVNSVRRNIFDARLFYISTLHPEED